MSSGRGGDGVLSPELEAIAVAASDRLRAQAGEDVQVVGEAQGRVVQAASAAIAAGVALRAIADAELAGELRARDALGAEALREVARAARRKREADGEYEQVIKRSGRLGLSHREIAGAAGVSHGTVRAVLARATASGDRVDPPLLAAGSGGVEGGLA